MITLRDRYTNNLSAGNRWHIDCFRCSICSIILDSDTNLILLGDGSFICKNCAYNCSVCDNKIEDLTILAGDQAFCTSCFKCRNCKKEIENLKYAGTSQGVFCMVCHEALMERRWKKSKAKKILWEQTIKESRKYGHEKALPGLPPSSTPEELRDTISDSITRARMI